MRYLAVNKTNWSFSLETHIEKPEDTKHVVFLKAPKLTGRALGAFLSREDVTRLRDLALEGGTPYSRQEAAWDLWLETQLFIDCEINGMRH